MSTIEIIVTALGGASILIAALAWLSKSIIVHYLNKDIETFKVNIKSENERQIEKLKHDLEMISNEHRVKFESLHTKRSNVIAELYEKIVDFYEGIDSFIGVILLCKDGDIEKEASKLWSKVDDFKMYAERNRIYFSEELCGLLDKLYDTADEPTSKLMVSAEYQNDDKDGKQNLYDSWHGAKESLETEVHEIRKVIENEFRCLIGVK